MYQVAGQSRLEFLTTIIRTFTEVADRKNQAFPSHFLSFSAIPACQLSVNYGGRRADYEESYKHNVRDAPSGLAIGKCHQCIPMG